MDKLPSEKVKRKILVKKEVKTNRVKDRTAEELIDYGIVNLDKPQGPTSHQVSGYVQKILKLKKAGHSGTLDPKVTGVLPTALGKATRIVQALIPAGKEYICIMHVHKDIEEQKLRKTIRSFKGKIKQKPPIRSAVKRVERFRKIYYIDIMEIEGKDVLFKVGCEAGTYIRKLCDDIGKKLGTGAHMAELRRTKVGPFDEKTLVTLQDLTDAYWYYKKEGKEEYIKKCIQPIENAIVHLPKVWVLDNAVESLCNGVNLKVPGISKLNDGIEPDQEVAVMSLADELVAIGRAKLTSRKMMDQEKGIAVKAHKVFMKN
ncbi:RNA-guided pseudouridylation complex pseudouridine synthase subunit Cbf5 [Candidatus Woesearchaeota archaeon]|nr:RNA-guided pseudouridylation complex pseudouridine synthase subunit Cbf5 [Candidatus Woesearchaeota archaeon]